MFSRLTVFIDRFIIHVFADEQLLRLARCAQELHSVLQTWIFRVCLNSKNYANLFMTVQLVIHVNVRSTNATGIFQVADRVRPGVVHVDRLPARVARLLLHHLQSVQRWSHFFRIPDFIGYIHSFSVELSPTFPSNKPAFMWQSVYHESNNGKPYFMHENDYPYSPRWSPEEMVKRAKWVLIQLIPSLLFTVCWFAELTCWRGCQCSRGSPAAKAIWTSRRFTFELKLRDIVTAFHVILDC